MPQVENVLMNLRHYRIHKVTWRGRFPGIAGKAGNHGNEGKFHKSYQINQIKRNINKLCLRKISRQKVVRIKFSVNSAFSNMLCGKK